LKKGGERKGGCWGSIGEQVFRASAQTRKKKKRNGNSALPASHHALSFPIQERKARSENAIKKKKTIGLSIREAIGEGFGGARALDYHTTSLFFLRVQISGKRGNRRKESSGKKEKRNWALFNH